MRNKSSTSKSVDYLTVLTNLEKGKKKVSKKEKMIIVEGSLVLYKGDYYNVRKIINDTIVIQNEKEYWMPVDKDDLTLIK